MDKDLKQLFETGIVKFSFYKTDGTVREAVGTRRFTPEYTGDNFVEPKGTGVEKPGIFTYWDTEKEQWRSFREENFISGVLIK